MDNSNELVVVRKLFATQGDTHEIFFRIFQSDGVTPVDISGWTFSCQVRTNYDSSGSPLASYTFTQAGYQANEMYGSLSKTQTAALPITPSTTPGEFIENTLTYDVKVGFSGKQFTIQRGPYEVAPSATR